MLVLKNNDFFKPLQGLSWIKRVDFNKDETEIIRWGLGEENVTAYQIYSDRKLKKEFYPLEAEVDSGVTLTKSGETKVLTQNNWLEKKKKYEQLVKE